MARSSILRTRLPEFVDECGSIPSRYGFSNVERHDDPPVRIRVEHFPDHRVSRLRLVSKAGRDIRQNISHIVARLPVLVVAEAPADEYRPDSVLEREPVGELPVHEGSLRQPSSELDRRGVVRI